MAEFFRHKKQRIQKFRLILGERFAIGVNVRLTGITHKKGNDNPGSIGNPFKRSLPLLDFSDFEAVKLFFHTASTRVFAMAPGIEPSLVQDGWAGQS